MLPLSAAPTVEAIAAFAPAVADALAAALVTGTITAAEVSDHSESALAELARTVNGEGPTLVAVPGYKDLGALALPADLAARDERSESTASASSSTTWTRRVPSAA